VVAILNLLAINEDSDVFAQPLLVIEDITRQAGIAGKGLAEGFAQGAGTDAQRRAIEIALQMGSETDGRHGMFETTG
jgi:hypothetical protein